MSLRNTERRGMGRPQRGWTRGLQHRDRAGAVIHTVAAPNHSLPLN
ncbi:unnamed protein product [Tenebrio molitor]|nr:unnamed protein product [Tenebrio molitor]